MKKITFFILSILAIFLIDFKSINVHAEARPSDPASVIIVTKDNFDLNTKLSPNTNEDYNQTSRNFQSMAKIQVVGKRLFAGWITGGSTEPHRDNYLAIAYSDDEGKTWIDPYMIIDHPATLEVAIKNFMMFVDQSGIFWICYYKEGRGFYAISSENADEENIDDIIWSNERYLSDYGSENRPTILQTGEWIYTSRLVDDSIKTPILSSVNYGKNFFVKGNAISSISPEKKFAGESAIIEKENGTLVLYSRIESNGGIERYFSYDEGASWTKSETNLPNPLRGPGSRFVMIKLPSKSWLFVTNNDDSERKNLTAYISKDEGNTWSNGFLIDERLGAEYPDASYDDKGNIYIIYDEGRTKEKEIRVCKLTEPDIIAGYYISDNYIDKGIINKLNPDYVDIVSSSLNTKYYNIELNDDITNIINKLPTSIKCFDSNDNEYSLDGYWDYKTVDTSNSGIYYVKFVTTLDENIQDTYQNLMVKIIVKNNEYIAGCVGSITSCLPIISLLALLFVLKKKRSFR